MRKRNNGALPQNVYRRGSKYFAKQVVGRVPIKTRLHVDVRSALRELDEKLEIARSAPRECWTLGQALDRFVDAAKRSKRERTALTYESHQRLFETVWKRSTRLWALDRDAIQAWVDLRRDEVSPTTLRINLNILRAIFTFAVDRGGTNENPLTGYEKRLVLPKKEHTEAVWIHRDDVEKRLAEIERIGRAESLRDWQHHYDVFLVSLCVGWRAAEACRCQVEDVQLKDPKRRRVSIPMGKTGYRWVPIPPKALPSFRRLIGARKSGRLISPHNTMALNYVYRLWSKRLGEPRWKSHALRHCYVTTLIDAGENLERVRKLAGHANLSTTARYAHVRSLDLHETVDRVFDDEPPRRTRDASSTG